MTVECASILIITMRQSYSVTVTMVSYVGHCQYNSVLEIFIHLYSGSIIQNKTNDIK